MANHCAYLQDMNAMKECFMSTYHPSCMVCWWVVVHSGPMVVEPLQRVRQTYSQHYNWLESDQPLGHFLLMMLNFNFW